MYVIKTNSGYFVAATKHDGYHQFTTNLALAKTFRTQGEAEAWVKQKQAARQLTRTPFTIEQVAA